MNFELFFSISASRPSCNFHARTCMKAHEKSPQIYGYIDYSTNSPACQLVFSINFHITFINPRLCEVRPAEKPFFQGEFYGAGQGQNARRGRKGCRKCFFGPLSRSWPIRLSGRADRGSSACLAAGSHPYILRAAARTEKPESGSRRVLF